MAKIRLHQFLSKTGIFNAKKDLLSAVKQGRIKVNEKIIANPHHEIKKKDKIQYDDRFIYAKKERIYLLLNKPEGYLSSKLNVYDIKLGKKSVFSLLKRIDEKVLRTLFCVGRLDENSSGLIMITNDGDLSYKITDPGSNIKKEYEVELEKPVSAEEKKKIEQGIVIVLEENFVKADYKTKPCRIKMLEKNKLLITLTEGKKREVRRIFESVGNKVKKLKRVCIGNLNLDQLKIPEGRYIAVSEEFVKKGVEK